MLILPPAKKKHEPNHTTTQRPLAQRRHAAVHTNIGAIYQVKLTDVSTRGGEYKGRVLVNPTKTGTTNVQPKDIGDDWTDDETSLIWVINSGELNAATHSLPHDGSIIVTVQIISFNDDGKAIGLILGAPNVASVGQYMGMVYMMTADNVVGWSFVKAHSIL